MWPIVSAEERQPSPQDLFYKQEYQCHSAFPIIPNLIHAMHHVVHSKTRLPEFHSAPVNLPDWSTNTVRVCCSLIGAWCCTCVFSDQWTALPVWSMVSRHRRPSNSCGVGPSGRNSATARRENGLTKAETATQHGEHTPGLTEHVP